MVMTMVRPRKDRMVDVDPQASYFKPRGIPMIDLKEVRLTIDELEALRLADLRGLTHEAAGQEMGVSRATFGRIVAAARRIVADALINGKAINVKGGNYQLVGTLQERPFTCERCHFSWKEPAGTGRPAKCPECRSGRLHRIRNAS
jgi:predicted DNA-binding protein (UPF0251 family)